MKDTLSNQPIGICCKKDRDWTQFVAAIDRETFEHVELSFAGSDPDSQMFDAALLAEVRALAAERGVPLSVHAPGGINLAEKVARLRAVSVQILCEAVVAAHRLDARWLTVHLGSAGFPNSDVRQKRARLALAAEALHDVLRATADSPVLLALENLPRNPASLGVCRLGDCGDELREVLSAIDSSRIGVVVDVGHARMFQDRGGVAELVGAVADRIVGFHLHWNDRRLDSHDPLPAASEELAAHLGSIRRLVGARAPVLLESHTLADNLRSARVLLDTARRSASSISATRPDDARCHRAS